MTFHDGFCAGIDGASSGRSIPKYKQSAMCNVQCAALTYRKINESSRSGRLRRVFAPRTLHPALEERQFRQGHPRHYTRTNPECVFVDVESRCMNVRCNALRFVACTETIKRSRHLVGVVCK